MATVELSLFWQHFYGWLNPIVTFMAAVAAGFFAYYQYKINKRATQLQDYVAINIIPFIVDGAPHIQIYSVGRANLYLHKYEIGNTIENYSHARLLACGSNMAFIIPVPQNQTNIEMPVKFYLKDEFDEKYISTGAVIIDQRIQSSLPGQIENQPTPAQTQAAQQFVIRNSIRAWSYKTEKYNWII